MDRRLMMKTIPRILKSSNQTRQWLSFKTKNSLYLQPIWNRTKKGKFQNAIFHQSFSMTWKQWKKTGKLMVVRSSSKLSYLSRKLKRFTTSLMKSGLNFPKNRYKRRLRKGMSAKIFHKVSPTESPKQRPTGIDT